MQKPVINVNSEIGTLKSVLLKRPGAEIENITPDTMARLLFDDIPYLKMPNLSMTILRNFYPITMLK